MAATKEDARAARDAKLDELHEKLTGAVETLVTGSDWVRALAFAARFRSRSFNNTLLIWTQHEANFEAGRVPEPVPTYVAGYRQWQQLGRQVQKGQPGYMIFAPVTGRFASSTPADSGSWRRLGPREKPKPGETVRARMVGARPAYVWDISQTAGDPIPEPPSPKLLDGGAPAGLWDGLVAQVEVSGFEVLRVPDAGQIGGADGLTDYTARQVSVRIDVTEANQVATLVHELAHVLMHDPTDHEARQHRGIREVEAESVALMIGAAHGMDTSSYTIRYVAGWASSVKDTEPAEVIKATGERVRKTALAILDQLDTHQAGNGTPPGLERDTPAKELLRVEPMPKRAGMPVLTGRGL
ncbi:ArdC-like ssDNA-binding domain-containing protein [Micropruina sp.]|uniref:ArdC-like ssDNA-binding domain-containing protein n=1 Tax=Micropruina sp. TaxID=2737536 RepID=UPI0039E63B64